ncbi:MAG: hypothetical protein GX907_00195 [Clostridiaceae bacterium]|nr:hypothetical protein [Clostridiaceae bacterium]
MSTQEPVPLNTPTSAEEHPSVTVAAVRRALDVIFLCVSTLNLISCLLTIPLIIFMGRGIALYDPQLKAVNYDWFLFEDLAYASVSLYRPFYDSFLAETQNDSSVLGSTPLHVALLPVVLVIIGCFIALHIVISLIGIVWYRNQRRDIFVCISCAILLIVPFVLNLGGIISITVALIPAALPLLMTLLGVGRCLCRVQYQ